MRISSHIPDTHKGIFAPEDGDSLGMLSSNAWPGGICSNSTCHITCTLEVCSRSWAEIGLVRGLGCCVRT